MAQPIKRDASHEGMVITPKCQYSIRIGIKLLHFAVRDKLVVVEDFDDKAFEGAVEGDVGLAVVGDAAEDDEAAV